VPPGCLQVYINSTLSETFSKQICVFVYVDEKIGVFLTQTTASLLLIKILVFEENANFFAENRQKSKKIVIITLTPDRSRVIRAPDVAPSRDIRPRRRLKAGSGKSRSSRPRRRRARPRRRDPSQHLSRVDNLLPAKIQFPP
jgi:hypothetical protein